MEDLVCFNDLAEQFGIYEGRSEVVLEDGTVLDKGAAVMHENIWGKEGGKKLLGWLDAHVSPGGVFSYDGHADCWLMTAAMYHLRQSRIYTYIGAFDRMLEIRPYAAGKEPVEGQLCTFSVEEKGNSVLLTVHINPDRTPFDMPFDEIGAPALPEGKDIFVRLDGRHLLFVFPMSLTYGAACRSLNVDFSGECLCAVSNDPSLEVGDPVPCPF